MSKRVDKTSSSIPPEPPKKQSSSSWWGRIVSLFFSNKTASKTEKVVNKSIQQKAVKETETEKIGHQKEREKLKERYENNYTMIFSIEKKIKGIRVKNGMLVEDDNPFREPTGKEKQEIIDLIQQTYRQAWGRVIESEHGFIVREKALSELNRLKQHLTSYLPEALPKADLEKPLKILTTSYRSDEQLNPQLQRERSKKGEESKKKVEELRAEQITTGNVAEIGANVAELIKADQDSVGVQKDLSDAIYADKIAISQGYGLDEIKLAKDYLKNPQMITNQNPEIINDIRQLAKELEHWRALGGFNETLASNLNVLVGGRLGIPLAERTALDPTFTTHAFAENLGNYGNIQGQKDLDMPLVPSQRFVFGEMILGNLDCHGGNILIGKEHSPIGIDYGQSLGDNPLSSEFHLRAAYIDFPCMDQPINPEDKKFFSELNIEQYMIQLEKSLKEQYPDFFADEIQKPIIEKNLLHLKARLIFVKEAVKQGLTQKQMLILFDFPHISPKDQNQLLIKLNIQEKYDYKANPLVARKALSGFGNDKGFKKAWGKAIKNGKFDTDQFIRSAKESIKEIKKVSPDKLLDETTLEWYRFAYYI